MRKGKGSKKNECFVACFPWCFLFAAYEKNNLLAVVTTKVNVPAVNFTASSSSATSRATDPLHGVPSSKSMKE